MDHWLFLGGCVFSLVLASILAMILTIVFRRKMKGETIDIFFGFIPLEFCIIFFGWPIAVAFLIHFVKIF